MPTTKFLGTNVRYSSRYGMSPLGWILWHCLWIAVTLVCLGLGVKNYFDERVFLAQAELDTGTITRYELHVRNDGKSEFCPRIEFHDKAGEPVAVQGSVCPNKPDKTRIGSTVQVYYDPNNPDAYEEKTAFTGFDGLIFGLIGAVFFGLFWFVPSMVLLVRWLRRMANPAAAGYDAAATAGLNDTMRQDAERYHANQMARERARHPGQPPHPAPANPLAAEEARLAQLKQQEEALQRKIDEHRRHQGQ